MKEDPFVGMFDWYKPSEALYCPIDGHPLLHWQGKDGPCLLLIWREGMKHPIDHWVDEEVRFSLAKLKTFTLPSTFTIYTDDCLVHQPIIATCATENDTWCSTEMSVPHGPGNARTFWERGAQGRTTRGREAPKKPREFILIDLTTQMPFLPSHARTWPRERLLAWLRVWGAVHRVESWHAEEFYTFESWVGRWTHFVLTEDGRLFIPGTSVQAWPEEA